jgi:hypothetical protein
MKTARLTAAAVIAALLVALHAHTVDAAVPPQASGVMDRDEQPAAAFRSVVSGWVVPLAWADIEPTQGTIRRSAIDAAVSAARAQGAFLKLRIYAGDESPAWAKALHGGAIQICDTDGAGCGMVPKFWTKEFGNAYANFQAELAAIYDGTPEIREVVIDRCTTLFAEPMLRQIGYKPNVDAFRAAGYTADLDDTCQRQAINAHQVWTQTRSSIALNPYQVINAGGTTTDETYTEKIMNKCRNTLGPRCVLGNNSLSDTRESADYRAMYNAIKRRGAPIYFQTAPYRKLQSLGATLQLAVDLGAGMVELPIAYENNVTAAQLQPYDQKLEAQAAT